jgi:alpha-glucosidase
MKRLLCLLVLFCSACSGGSGSSPVAASAAAVVSSQPAPAKPHPQPQPCAAHPTLAAPVTSASALGGPLPPSTCLSVGEFRVHWRPGGANAIAVTHKDASTEALLASAPDEAFLGAAQGRANVLGGQSAGFFQIQDRPLWEANVQEVSAIEHVGGGVELRGLLLGGPVPTSYTLRFDSLAPNQLGFAVALGGSANRVRVTWASHAGERVFGFGEQFSQFDHKGLRVPILTREQGIGRGLEPLTSILTSLSGIGGDWSHTYYAVPWAFTNDRRGWLLEDSEYSVFDLVDPTRVQVELFSSSLRGRIMRSDSLLGLLTELTSYTGRMEALPDWTHEGAIIGMTGGETVVRDRVLELRRHDVPVSAFFLQDWVGERSTAFGTRLWWNWESDTATYPDWSKLVSDLNAEGYRVMSYVNPWLADVSGKAGVGRNLYREAEGLGYLVRNQAGGVWGADQGGYQASLVDLSNPAAFDWLKEVLKQQVLSTGVSGWMGDFGESLPFDAQLHGADAKSYHNRYPEEWARLQEEAIAEVGRAGEVVYFSRSGFTRSPGKTRLFWAGDQLTTWDEHDGLKSSITALLTSGVSGATLNHSDIGGYTTIGLGPLVFIQRDRELLLRWMELNAFTAVYRTHEGLHPNAGHQLTSDPATLDHFARMAKVFRALFPYRKTLMQEAEQLGWPIVRHPYLHAQEPELLKQRYAFMLGSEYFVAPVVDPGQSSVRVYLPRGRWVNVWSDRIYGDAANAGWAAIPAPIGFPAVLFREGSAEGARLIGALRRESLRR